MKAKEILQAMNDVDTELVAMPAKSKKWMGWTAAAAAACLTLVLSVLFLNQPPADAPEAPTTTPNQLGGIVREYVNGFTEQSAYPMFPWEYKTVWEQYTALTLNGVPYHSRAHAIAESKLGEDLGEWTVKGYDPYTETQPERTAQVRAITGVDQNRLVAAQLDGDWYVFLYDRDAKPATFGAFMDELNLAKNLPLTHFTTTDEDYYSIENDSEIWKILSACRDAKQTEDSDYLSKREHISFTATSEELGISNLVFTITADGFVKTNILNFGCNYFIGTDAARQILDYATANKQPATWESDYWLAGTVTEIGDGYILVDDSVMMANPADGMVFRISTEDVRVRRWVEWIGAGIKVGDFVVVRYTDGVDTENNNNVLGAYSINKAELADGTVLIPG